MENIKGFLIQVGVLMLAAIAAFGAFGMIEQVGR